MNYFVNKVCKYKIKCYLCVKKISIKKINRDISLKKTKIMKTLFEVKKKYPGLFKKNGTFKKIHSEAITNHSDSVDSDSIEMVFTKRSYYCGFESLVHAFDLDFTKNFTTSFNQHRPNLPLLVIYWKSSNEYLFEAEEFIKLKEIVKNNLKK